MASSGRTSNKKLKRAKKRAVKHKLAAAFVAEALKTEALVEHGAGDLIALVQKERQRPALPFDNEAQEELWSCLEEMRECSRKGFIEFTQDEKYFIFQLANRSNCTLFTTARQIAQLYEFRKVFDIYWKSVKRNRKF